MGGCCSKPVAPAEPPPPSPEEEVESDDEEDPRYILLVALRRFAMTYDPNYPLDKVETFRDQNEHLFQWMSLQHKHLLFKEGNSVDALYVVIRGHLSVIDEDTDQEIMRIFRKDFYCDVEILYDMESQYRVQPFDKCDVCKIPTACVNEFRSTTTASLPSLVQWYATRCYKPHASLKADIVHAKMCRHFMHQVSLFSRWHADTVEGFIEFMGKMPMIYCKSGFTLAGAGHAADTMYILVRGSVTFELGDDHYAVDEQEEALPIGEEGVFNDGSVHRMTIRAGAPCYVIAINKHWVWHASDNVWEFAEGAEPHWTNSVRKWRQVLTERKDHIYTSNLAPLLSIELIYTWLRNTKSFRRSPVWFMYEIAKCGKASLITKNTKLSYQALEKCCMLLVHGEMRLLTDQQVTSPPDDADVKPLRVYKPTNLIYAKPHKSAAELSVTATCDCLVVRISIADLLDQASNGDVIVPLDIDFLQQTY